MSYLCYIYIITYRERTKVNREGKSKGTDRQGRKRTRAKDAADLFARSSPLLLLRLMSSPSTPSPAAHTSPRRTITEGTGGHLVRFWAMLSPPHLNTSPPTSRPFLASPSVPSAVLTVRTIASRSSGRTTNKGEGRAGTLPGSGWMPSPPPRHRSTSNQRGSASFCLSSCPPRPLPRPLPLHQVVRVGQRASRGGRSPPAHPADPLHPAGVCGRIYRKV